MNFLSLFILELRWSQNAWLDCHDRQHQNLVVLSSISIMNLFSQSQILQKPPPTQQIKQHSLVQLII